MKSPAATRRIIDMLAEQHPNADTELHYRNAFELLVATILSAQSTDERVNRVTPALFKRYPDADSLAKASPSDLQPLIVSTGFFNQKGKALLGMAQTLVAEHGGNVPADMDKLTALPGVGRKTANVVLGHALGVPGLPVDRHVLRVSNRIGIAEGDDPEKVEAQLCAALPKQMWTLASDVQILHGRRICRPKPLCDQCSVRDYCDYFRHVISVGPPAGGPHTRAKEQHTRVRNGGTPRGGLHTKKKSGSPQADTFTHGEKTGKTSERGAKKNPVPRGGRLRAARKRSLQAGRKSR
jgi:endonuclease-3